LVKRESSSNAGFFPLLNTAESFFADEAEIRQTQ